MLKRLTPFFELSSDPSTGSWSDLASSAMNPDPVDDGQPAADPDTAAQELTDPPAEGKDVVEPNPDEANKPEADADKPADDKAPALSDETEIDLGEGRQPVKLAELKQGYLRQSDYTKKTQALADERTAFDAERTEVKPYQNWMNYIQSNPFLFDQIQTAINEWERTGLADWSLIAKDADVNKWVNGFKGETAKLAKENETLKARLGDIEFGTSMDKVVGELKSDYGDLVTSEFETKLRDRAKTQSLSSEVAKEIAEGQLTKLKLAKAPDPKKLSKEAEAKTIQSLQEKKLTLPPTPRTTGFRPSDDAGNISEKGWFDLARESM